MGCCCKWTSVYTYCHSSICKAWQFRAYISYLLVFSCLRSLPAFAGQLIADDTNRINATSWKALCRGVTYTAFDTEEIIDNFDHKLISKNTNHGHCVHHLLPPKPSAHCPYSLRKREHYYQLLNIEFLQYKNSFISRCLFKFRWSYFVYFV